MWILMRSLLYSSLSLLVISSVEAQIIPDGSLGNESSRVMPNVEINGIGSDRIEGGAIRGDNLFHSFSEFNIGEGRGAYFSNPDGIANIFSRVTGTNPSNILGTLGVLGNANLYFLNPNGIIFGPNARLDLRGSFLATTADSFVFDSGFEFAASNPQTPLLTINIPIGLQFRNNPGIIVNRSTATVENLPPLPLQIINNDGLAVQPRQTLALVGGDVQLDGGILTANSGQILLGSVASHGFVSFNPNPLIQTLNYENIQTFGNIQISDAAINTSGLGGGRLEIRGKDVLVSRSQIAAQTLGNENGRGISIRADAVRLEGGKEISTFTFGSGMGGPIDINATELVELSGIGVQSFREFIDQIIRNGIIQFFDPNLLLVTGSSTGAGGDLTINTGRLLLRDGASIVPTSVGALTITDKKGGEIRITTPRLIVRDGGVISTASLGAGNASNITIDAQEIEVIGSANDGQFISKIEASSGSVLGVVNPDATGQAGSLNISTNRLIIRDRAAINVANLGSGDAGKIEIVAGAIALDTGGSINATTTSGGGGNITLNTQDIQLRRGSRIATDAGSSQGGDIRINSNILLGFPGENSDITANAQTAKGGTVTINVDNIFGIAAISRDQIRNNLGLTDAELEALTVNPTFLLPSNDIAAISQASGANLQGTVTFTASGINPAQGLLELPENIVDPATIIAANPCAETQESAFVITGRGGLPANPTEPLREDPVRVSWSELPAQESRGAGEQVSRGDESLKTEIVPAQGWAIDDKGMVTLVAYNPGNAASVRHPKPQTICPPR